MEWLILILLVPAVVVPVVLLWGFAGCDLVFKLKHIPPPKPLDLVATPKSISEISLTWTSTEAGLQFEIQHAEDGGNFQVIATVSDSPFVDPPNSGTPEPLKPGITYNYQVFAFDADDKSAGSNVASARTLAFEFDLTTVNGVNEDLGGGCIVQKIGGALLKNWGTIVKIHVRGSTANNLTINSMYISGVAPVGTPGNPNPDSYDSASDLVPVNFGVVVPAGSVTAMDVTGVFTIPAPPASPPDVLIAFDISASIGQGNVRHALLTGAEAHTRDTTQQASLPDRFPNPDGPAKTYKPFFNQLYLVEKIEVL